MLDFINACMTEACGKFDLTIMKVDAVMEAAKRELSINYDEAELKVMQEHGTDEDLAYYYREAENGLVDTVKAAIIKIRDAIAKFFSEVKAKIISIFSKKENIEAIEKVEKKCKIFPFLGRKKILVEDYSKQAKIADEAMGKVKKTAAKAAAGQDVSNEEVDEIKETFMEKHGAQLGIAAAAATTIVGAIALVKIYLKKSSTITATNEKDVQDTLKMCGKYAETAANPGVFQKLAGTAATVAKEKTNDFVRILKDTMGNIKKTVTKFGKSATDVAKGAAGIAESTDNPDTLMNDKDMQNITNSVASPNGDMNEFGDDPINDIPGYGDEPDDTSDVWDDVMGTSAGLDLDDTDECGDSFESAFDRLFEKVTSCDDSGYHCSPSSSKSSNEQIIADLYADISDEARFGTGYAHQYAKESTFDRLMSEIDDMMFD